MYETWNTIIIHEILAWKKSLIWKSDSSPWNSPISENDENDSAKNGLRIPT